MTTSEMKSEIIRLVGELAKEGINTEVEPAGGGVVVNQGVSGYQIVTPSKCPHIISFTEETAV